MRSKVILAVLVCLSLLVGGYDALLYHLTKEIGIYFATIWVLVFYSLTALWIDADSRERKDIYRPFEYDYLVFVFAVPYLPYYLVRTRGALGILWLFGLVALFYFGYLLKLLLYAAS